MEPSLNPRFLNYIFLFIIPSVANEILGVTPESLVVVESPD